MTTKSLPAGLIRKHADRVLLIPTWACDAGCAYCYQKEKLNSGTVPAKKDILSWIRAHPEVREVILSGGEPLMLSPKELKGWIRALEQIPSLEVLRLHTRRPVVLPEKISNAHIRALKTRRLPLYVVLHVQTAEELTPAVLRPVRQFQKQGAILLSQSVLTRGQNDTVEALEALFRALVAAGIKPYDLHQMERYPQTEGLEVPLAEGQGLIKALRERVSGLCLPHYMLDLPGAPCKVAVPEGHVEILPDGHTKTEFISGQFINYQ